MNIIRECFLRNAEHCRRGFCVKFGSRHTNQSAEKLTNQATQFREQHEWNKARCKGVVVAVGNCKRAMCVRARRCQCSSTESARSPPQRLYKAVSQSLVHKLSLIICVTLSDVKLQYLTLTCLCTLCTYQAYTLIDRYILGRWQHLWNYCKKT